MQAIDYVEVTSNEEAEKRPPQGRGVGVRWILGEETGKMDQGPGKRKHRV
jgi:hypothetical protein